MEDFGFLIHLIRTYGYIVIGAGIFLECMGVPFPGETVLILGGVAAFLGHLNLAIVILIAALAAIAGDNMGYFIGKKFGRKIIKRFEKFPLFHYKHVDRAERFFKLHGNKTVFIGRFTAILRTYSALFAGIFDMPYPIFFFYNLCGGVLWAVIFGFIGFSIGNNFPLIGKIISDFNLVFLGIFAAFIVWILGRRWLRKSRAAQQPALQTVPSIENLAQDRAHGGIQTDTVHLPTHKTAAPIMSPQQNQEVTENLTNPEVQPAQD